MSVKDSEWVGVWRNIKNVKQIHRTHDMPSYIQYRPNGINIEYIRFHEQQRPSTRSFPTTISIYGINFETGLDVNRKIFIDNAWYSLPFFINREGKQYVYDRRSRKKML